MGERLARLLPFRETGQRQELFLCLLLAFLAGGIFVGFHFAVPLFWGGGLALAFFLLCSALVFRESRFAFLAFFLLFFALGVWRVTMADFVPADDISRLARQEARVRGELLAPPRVSRDAQGEQKLRYEIAVRETRLGGKAASPASGGLYIYARVPEDGVPPVAQIGDTVTATGKIRLPRGYWNPGQLDTALLLKCDGITATLAAGKAGVTVAENDAPDTKTAFLRALAAVRVHYRTRMAEAMPADDAAALFAMLFGGYEGIDPALLADFTTTGIVHILSVSGSHVSLLAAVLAALGAALRLPRFVTAAAVLFALVSYTLLAGCVPPALRAALMGGLAFLAFALGRERAAGRLFLIVCIFLLLFSPLWLFHISFELSALSTAGLLYLAPPLTRWLLAREFFSRHLPRFVAASLALTLCAQAMSFPVIAWYFHQVSLSSLLANLLVVPLVELLIVLGLAAGIVAFFLPPLGRLAFALGSLLLGLVAEMTRLLAALPASKIYVPAPNILAVCIWYFALALPFLPEMWRGRAREFLVAHRKQAGALAACALCVCIVFYFARPRDLAVHFIDVGQGDAALVVTPHGHAFLVDAGGTREQAFDVGGRVTVPYLLHYGARDLDAAFLSHAHEDHAAGLGSVLRLLPVRHVFTANEGRAAYAASLGISTASPVFERFHAMQTGERYQIDGVTVEVLAAPENTATMTEENELCDVLRVSYGAASFLFTGDMGVEQEEKLLASGANVRATVLKVGHHGSRHSSGEHFLRAVAPRFAVISVGADNSYGHPTAEALARIEQEGAQILRTDEKGAIVFHTDGEKLWAESYAAGKENLNGR